MLSPFLHIDAPFELVQCNLINLSSVKYRVGVQVGLHKNERVTASWQWHNGIQMESVPLVTPKLPNVVPIAASFCRCVISRPREIRVQWLKNPQKVQPFWVEI